MKNRSIFQSANQQSSIKASYTLGPMNPKWLVQRPLVFLAPPEQEINEEQISQCECYYNRMQYLRSALGHKLIFNREIKAGVKATQRR